MLHFVKGTDKLRKDQHLAMLRLEIGDHIKGRLELGADNGLMTSDGLWQKVR